MIKVGLSVITVTGLYCLAALLAVVLLNCSMSDLQVGRTHGQDAVPLTVGQEMAGYAAQVREDMSFCMRCNPTGVS